VSVLAAAIRIGTCSWADEALTKHWYPNEVKSAEARLRYYAERFSTVEVDSTYYRLPDEPMVSRWAEQLPPDLREGAPLDDRGRVDRPPREFRAEVFRRFHRALEPLRETGKLGGILLQFPPYVVYKDLSVDYLRWAVDQLDGDRALVEFRHRSWLDEENRGATLALLEELGASHVVVDSPKTEAKNLVPTVVAATSPLAYVRFHGRNASTWNARGGSASDRFDYLYSDDELQEWVEPLRELRKSAEEVYVLFNNNRWSRRPDGELAAQAPANATALQRILDFSGVSAH
jgi:uncharacterized protein YecE (DUF72 family)